MFLNRLEISGFKSFPEKLKLDFPVGITAIVGPNGSGKSNIADAVRWVMGEQSAKSLRGAKMDDVIFAGTEHRKRGWCAEVQMIIDNSMGLLPINFSEVGVTRRLYRSGESEYLLNNSSCRMRDIHQLFMDTGVGQEGYSIIGQGRVDEILSTRSEDRRHLFEEAAGIVKYKTRRSEALLKLEKERQNLRQADIAMEEIRIQLEPLAEQAHIARAYLNLRDQYKIIHVNLFLNEAAKTEEQVKYAKKQLTDLSGKSEWAEKKLAQAGQDLNNLREAAEHAEADYKDANHEIIKLVRELEQIESSERLVQRIGKEIEKRSTAIVRKENELKEINFEDCPTEDKIKEKETELKRAQAKLTDRGKHLQSEILNIQQKLHNAASRHKILCDMEREHEGYYNSVKAVLREKDRNPDFGKGILGTAGELLAVPQAYETAISVALGSASQNILTSTEADARRAIEYLKAKKAGRATFLPVSAMKPRNAGNILQEPGIIGLASKLVTFDTAHTPVFEFLLGNTYVAEHLQRAIEISKKHRQAYRLVTLEGDVISPGGAMTGGSQNRLSMEFLSRSRQISEAADEISVLQIRIAELEESKKRQIEEEQKIIYEMDRLTEQKIRYGFMAQNTQNNVDRLAEELKNMEAEKISLEAELSDLQKESQNAAALRAQLKSRQRNQAETEEKIARIKISITHEEKAQIEYMETIARLSKEAARLEARSEQMEAESRRLHNEIWDTYELTYQSAQVLYDQKYDINFLRNEEKRLKAEISALGTVNIGAIEAHAGLNKRYNIYSEQREDILKAEEQLQEIICELTEQMEQQFSVQFALMAKHFNDVFVEMFGGGIAGLSMSDPDNILESGIEINAQPPGKNLQRLSLLSGGERALTAIALLFGILRMKPLPFCILDEIESALDDANVARFAQFLKAHAGDTQFIVITHRKGTMEAADTLYGITMQELGVSKMVSVELV